MEECVDDERSGADERSYDTPDTIPRLYKDNDSRRMRTILAPWDKPEKARSKFAEKDIWNGTRATFRVYRKMIEGHLLQVNAGYLIDSEFLTEWYTQSFLNVRSVLG